MRTFAVYGPQDSPSVINWTPNSSIPLSAYLTVFSFTGGLTAMAGMTLPELGNLKSGDVVLVSAAAGHVGQLCCQIARAKGASKVIGIAGGNDNCEFLKRELKVDVAIDYKKGNVEAAIKEAAPNGVNLYFDNVGGEITNAAMKNMARFGRVVICGLISAYNEESGASAQLDHFENVLMDRLKISGFIVGDHQEHFPNFIQTLSEWVKNGSLALPAFEQEVGIENAIKALNRLLKGDKRPGTKMIVAVSPEPTNH
jgi:NADPH-dependent curcumin reductase CurA